MYIESSNIKVYPTNKRSQNFDSSNSSLNFENNISNINSNINDYISYIVSGLDLNINSSDLIISSGSCIINGYLINIKNSLTIANISSSQGPFTKYIYLKLTLTSNGQLDGTDSGTTASSNYQCISYSAETVEKTDTLTDKYLCLGKVIKRASVDSTDIILSDTPKYNIDNVLFLTSDLSISENSGNSKFIDWLQDNNTNFNFIVDNDIISVQDISDSYSIRALYEDGTVLYLANTIYDLKPNTLSNKESIIDLYVSTNITHVEVGALSNCQKLKNLTIPFVGSAQAGSRSEVKLFGHIFGKNSYDNSISVYQYDNGTYYLPQTLESVTLLNQIYLPNCAFKNCATLKNINLPATIQEIGAEAFINCTLDTIYLSDNLKHIGGAAFGNCINFTHIEIPDNVTYISNAAFYGCYNLESIILPFVGSSIKTSASEETLFGWIFGSTQYSNSYSAWQDYRQTTVNPGAQVPDTVPVYYIPNNLTEVIIKKGPLFYGAFQNCKNISKIILPDSITSLTKHIFYGCKALADFTIPQNTTSIDIYTFYGCESLTNIILPKNVTSLAANAFHNCIELSQITFNDALTTIGKWCFQNCKQLVNIEIPSSVISIGENAFWGCKKIASIILPFVGLMIKNENDTNQYPFGYIFGASSWSGSTATSQSYYSSSLSSLTTSTFYIPTSLTTVTITGGNILTGAFQNCNNIVDITLPQNVTKINSNAFSGCTALNNLVIPSSIVNFNESAFNNCSALKTVYYNNIIDSWYNIQFANNSANPLNQADNFYVLDNNGSVTYKDLKYTKLTQVIVPIEITNLSDYVFPNNIVTIKFNVIFKVNNEVHNSQIVTKGSYASKPSNPSMIDRFDGWTLDGSTIVNVNNVQINQNTTFIAKITKAYPVWFVADDEVVFGTIAYDGQAVQPQNIPNNPEKLGYVFDGWTLNTYDIVNVSNNAITKETTYYAIFSAPRFKTCDITFNPDILGGEYIWSCSFTKNNYTYTNSFYSEGSNQFIFKESTWIPYQFYTNLDSQFSGSGENIWDDGSGNYYYSEGEKQYILSLELGNNYSNTIGNLKYIWSEKTWSGLTSFDGQYVWKDASNNVYYSAGSTQYQLNKSTSTWTQKTWSGLTSFYGDDVWKSGSTMYVTFNQGGGGILTNPVTYTLSGSTWSTKTWSGSWKPTYGSSIWSDGSNIYYKDSYVLSGSTWVEKEWKSNLSSDSRFNFASSCIWYNGSSKYRYINNHPVISRPGMSDTSERGSYTLDTATGVWSIDDPLTYNIIGSEGGYYDFSDLCDIIYNNDSTNPLSSPIPAIPLGTALISNTNLLNLYKYYLNGETQLKYNNGYWTQVNSIYLDSDNSFKTLSLYGKYIWTDGNYTYYSGPVVSGSTVIKNLVLDSISGSILYWRQKTWLGIDTLKGENIWKDLNNNIYYSEGSNHYQLNKLTSTWTEKIWNGLTNFEGYNIWSDSSKIYYSASSNSQYELDTSTSTWIQKTWNGYTNITGRFIWTDTFNIYYNGNYVVYVLDKNSSTWVQTSLGFDYDTLAAHTRTTPWCVIEHKYKYMNSNLYYSLRLKTYVDSTQILTYKYEDNISDERILKDWTLIEDPNLSYT